MANFFRSVLLRLQNKTVTAGTSASSVTKDSGYDGLGTVTINPTPSETKTQAAGTSNIDVTPTSGKLLSKVTVTPTPTETKSATPSTSAQTITPSSGKYLSSVSVGAISTQTKSATPSTSAQTITPDSGKYLTSVSISAISTETKSQAAGTSNIDVTPTSGKYLTKVTITPQQHSDSFTPTANLKGASGNANDMGLVHNKRFVDTSGMIVPSGNKSITANGTGIDVKNYATASVSVSGTSIAPSNSSPVAMTSGTLYTPSSDGYAIESYTSIAVDSGTETSISSKTGMYKITKSELTTPATVVGGTIQSKTPDISGVSFDAGMVKMGSGGYAYPSKPTPKLTRMVLWTNSAPTSSFSAQSVTLSQSIRNFDYIEVSWRSMTSQTNITSTIMSVAEFVSITSSTYNYCRLGTVNYGNSDSIFHRSCTYESNTSVKFVTGSSSGRCVPQYIYGLKLALFI